MENQTTKNNILKQPLLWIVIPLIIIIALLMVIIFNNKQATPKNIGGQQNVIGKTGNTIYKKLGDEIELQNVKFKVNKIEEKPTITGVFGSQVAGDDAKFVVVNIDITNIIKTPIVYAPPVFILVDNKGRKFPEYENTIGYMNGYLDGRTLSPDIKENGSLAYKLPNDANNYMLEVMKGGTNDTYGVLLK